MKILLLTDGVPYPPDRGPRVKTYQLLRYLAANHRVTLVSLVHDAEEQAHALALRPLCASIHLCRITDGLLRHAQALVAALASQAPYTVALRSSPGMHTFLARLVAAAAAAGDPFDLVHDDRLVMAPYAAALPLPRLLDAHNALWTIYAQRAERHGRIFGFAERIEARRLRDYERKVCTTFEAVITVSEEDREALLATGARPRDLSVIPIGIDADALAPVARDPEARLVLSLASPGWPPNAEGIAWFARSVYPLVRRAVPESSLSILGSEPTPTLRALATEYPGIELTGLVDPRSYLERTAVLIAPLRQRGGMRVMLPEALARGVPVVATSVACGDLDLVSGEHLLVADTASSFADAVSLLLRDPELGQRIAAAGRQYVLERYDWRAVYAALDQVYARMVSYGAHQRGTNPEAAMAAS